MTTTLMLLLGFVFYLAIAAVVVFLYPPERLDPPKRRRGEITIKIETDTTELDAAIRRIEYAERKMRRFWRRWRHRPEVVKVPTPIEITIRSVGASSA